MYSFPYLVTLLAIVYVAMPSTTTDAQVHRKKIILGRRSGPEHRPLWSDERISNPFNSYDLDGDGFLSPREFRALPLCRDPAPCDMTLIAQELQKQLESEQDEWRQ